MVSALMRLCRVFTMPLLSDSYTSQEDNLHVLHNINFSHGKTKILTKHSVSLPFSTRHCFISPVLFLSFSDRPLMVKEYFMLACSNIEWGRAEGNQIRGRRYPAVTQAKIVQSVLGHGSTLGHCVRDFYVTHEPSQSFTAINGFSRPVKCSVDILGSAAA